MYEKFNPLFCKELSVISHFSEVVRGNTSSDLIRLRRAPRRPRTDTVAYATDPVLSTRSIVGYALEVAFKTLYPSALTDAAGLLSFLRSA